MRNLAWFLVLLPLGCATQAGETQDPPPSDSTDSVADSPLREADSPPKEDATKEAEGTDGVFPGGCISTGGLPPGSVPDSIAQWAELELDALAAALPKDPRDPDSDTTTMKRGQAGHASPIAMRSFHPPKVGTSIVSIVDLQHVCRCADGMGKVLLEAAVAEGDVSETIDARPVAVKTKDTVVDFRIWIGDRCEVLIRSPSREEAEALFKATDWSALDKTCSSREGSAP